MNICVNCNRQCSTICKSCKSPICYDKCSFDCELCYKTFCWDCCNFEDQGSDDRCFCINCGDFCYEQGIFDSN